MHAEFWEKWIEAHGGYHFLFGKEQRFSFIPYTGYGYYAFDDKWKETHSLLRIHAWYVPLGATLSYLFNPAFSLGTTLQVDFMTTGHWKFEGHPIFSKMTNSLKRTRGYLVEILFDLLFQNPIEQL